ncbi:MAG: hypothetical protein JNL36_02705 [Candidatus Kapabacteria bacterium]|nr:hypothetical protein [Candidatus Kapabacteria bacterium]
MYNFLVEHSIFVVLITTLLVFGGFILFLWRLDKKVSLLENNLDQITSSNKE